MPQPPVARLRRRLPYLPVPFPHFLSCQVIG
jgi:hypothetical protein